MQIVNRMFVGFVLFVGTSSPIMAGDYDPLPKGWSIKIGLPGVLSVGAEYCTEAGVCHFVGAQQDCVLEPPPPQDPCHKRGVPPGAGCVPQKVCHPGAAPGIDMSVSVLAESPAGSVIIRVQEKNYATGKDHLSVIYHGVRMPLLKYDQCYSPGTHVIVAPIGASPCPPLPPNG